jgi:wyosine [tRNA(Phe)-imidazoG37] synthetase (radical SAM superfamily)
MNYKHLFGPVPSRRLGVSLGVDLVNKKTCNFNCVYCECGEAPAMESIRKEYVNIDAVVEEVKHYLEHGNHLDFITFSGNGEPTLNSGIGRLVIELKKITDTKICLITNSSTLVDSSIFEEIKDIDLIMPSLDAVLNESFIKMDRPHSSIKLEDVINGLIDFRKIYKGQIWLELFMLEGVNDSDEELAKFVEVIKEIGADRVQLNSLDRPAPVKWVKAMSMKRLEEIRDYFESKGIDAEIIKKYSGRSDYRKYNKDYEKLILNMIDKRPCTIEDFEEVVDLNLRELGTYIEILIKEKIIEAVIEERGIFYRKI